MVRTKDSDNIKSSQIVSEVQKRACLYDTHHPHYIDRSEKAKAWEEVCANVVPAWTSMGLEQKFAAGKEVQKRWRSVRDSFTKAYRQGKCVPPEQCQPGSRRYQYHRQMSFLLKAIQNKKPRYSQDKSYESFSEVSNSPQHFPSDDFAPKIKAEISDKPLDLKKPIEKQKTTPVLPALNRFMVEKQQETPNPTIDKPQNIEPVTEKLMHTEVPFKNPPLEIKIDSNTILPEDHFDDDKLFMNSLIPLFKKMDDDTRLLCRIEVLKIMRYALQGHKCFEALRMAEDNFFKNRLSGILGREESPQASKTNESTLSMVTRSADGSRPIRKRKIRSPSPAPAPTKKRGPGRPRKIRPPSSDTDLEEVIKRKGVRKHRSPCEPRLSEMDEKLSRATSVAQLETPLFMKMYNLERSKNASQLGINPLATQATLEVSVKTEPMDSPENLLA